MVSVPWTAHALSPTDPVVHRVAATLDSVLAPLGFAAGQAGGVDGRGQVIFCRGDVDSNDGGCVDLVVDLHDTPRWHIIDVRYWGFTSDRWHLQFEVDADLDVQLRGLVRTLPVELG